MAIFVLYFAQIALGGFIHYFKSNKSTSHLRKRPLQNYLHAVLGLLIIAFAFYQVRTGYRDEWTKETGRPALPKGVNIVWIVWVVVSLVYSRSGWMEY